MRDNEWTYEHFDLVQLILTREFCGVWCFEVDGDAYLDAYPLDAIGIAKVSTITMVCEGRTEKRMPIRPREIERHVDHRVVGLDLCGDGSWSIVNEASNFAGMCRVGADYSECDWELERKYTDKLKATKAKKELACQPQNSLVN